MATIADIRKKYPQYNDLSDRELAEGFHRNFYSDIPFDDFAKRIGLEERTVLGQIGETFKAVPRGVANTVLSTGEGLAELADAATNLVGAEGLVDSGDENALVKASKEGRDWIANSALGADPSYQDAWFTKFGEGAGSMLTFLAPVGILRGLGVAGKAIPKLGTTARELALTGTLATGSGAGEQAQRVAAARAQGLEVTQGEEDAAVGLGGLVGLSEVAPIAFLLKRIPSNTTPANKSRILDLLRRSMVGGFQEGMQEAIAGATQNLIEQQVYNENIPVGQSLWDDLTVGGAVGAFADFVVNAAAGRRSFMTTQAQREYEAQAREREQANIEKIRQSLATAAERRANIQADPEGFTKAAAQAQAAAAGIAAPTGEGPPVQRGGAYARAISRELGDYFPTNTKFTVEALPLETTPDFTAGTPTGKIKFAKAKQKFVVKDSQGNQYGQTLDDKEEAAALAYGLNTEAIDQQVRGQVLNTLETAGQSYDQVTADTLTRYGVQILNPDRNKITSAAINEAAGTTADKGYIENYSFQTILDGQKDQDGYVVQGPNQQPVKVPGLTAAQQINQKRKEKGLPETQVFTVEEAREALGDKFERLTDINVAAIPDNLTYTATIIDKKPVVVSAANEVFESRFASQEDSDAAGKNEDGTPKVKVGQKIELKSLEDAQAFAERKNKEAARGQGLSTAEINALLKGKKTLNDEINNLLTAKNISSGLDSPEIKTLFKSIVGKESLSDMDFGEQRLLYARLRTLPMFEATTKLPVFEAKPYTRDNFLAASKFVQDANSLGQAITDDQIAQAAGLLPNDERKDVKVQAIKADLVKQGVPVTKAEKPVLALPAPTGTTDTYNFLREEIRKKMKGFGLDDIATRIDQTLLNFGDPVRYMQEVGAETEGYYNPFLREITLAVDRIDPQKTLTPEQRVNALVDVLNHEIVHPVRELDLWTAKEWDTLSNAAARLKRKDDQGKDTGQTYLEWSRQTYGDQSPLVQEEESVADLSRQAKKFGAKAVAGKPKVLADKLFTFFDRLDNSFRGAGFQSYSDILDRLQSGEVGARTRGEIRTLRATEAEMAQQGILPERFGDYQPILATPVVRNQEREKKKVEVQQKAQTSGITDFNPNALEGAAIRESRRAIENIPKTIDVDGVVKPTDDSEGRAIYSGYEGPEMYGIETAPTQQGLRNFWKWFGKSKAADNQGRPLVYYHGTAADITAFRPKQAGAVFVTRNIPFAESFGDLSSTHMIVNFPDFIGEREVLDVLNESMRSATTPKFYDRLEKIQKRVATRFNQGKGLDAKSITDIKELYTGKKVLGKTDIADGVSSSMIESIEKRLPSNANLVPVYVSAQNPFDYENNDDVKRVIKRVKEISPVELDSGDIEGLRKGDWVTVEGLGEASPILDAIKSLGYDSMYIEESGIKNLAVFNPNQIKSAIGNNGQFGPTPSIRESRVPTSKAPNWVSQKVWDLHEKALRADQEAAGLVPTEFPRGVLTRNVTMTSRRLLDAVGEYLGVDRRTPEGGQRVIDFMVRMNEESGRRETGRGFGIQESRKDVQITAAGPEIPGNIDTVSSLNGANKLATSRPFPNNRTFKQALQDRVNAAAQEAGVDLTNFDDPSVIKYLVRVGVADALRAMQTNRNAIGWYDRKVRAALNILAKIHPELATDKNSRFAFTFALAVTSNGMKVNRNFELAEKAYTHWKRTGQMPTDIGEGTAGDSINEAMAMFNRLAPSLTMDMFRKMMLTDFKVSQLNRMGFEVDGELADTDVRGAAIVGPKIGNGFFSNLYGFFDALTMDRWLMRTWGRWSGTLLSQKPELLAKQGDELISTVNRLRKNKKDFARLQEIIGVQIPQVPKSIEERNAWLATVANAINKASTNAEVRQQINDLNYGDSIRKQGNNYAKTLDGQNEAPANGAQRAQIRRVFNQILQELRKTNPDLTMSDLQALLWYPEKRLYDTSKSKEDVALQSYEDEDAPDYANAAATLARRNNVPESEIKDAIAKADADSTSVRAAAAGRGTVQDQAVAAADQRPEVLSGKQRKRFIAQSILSRLRSNRRRNGTASGPYRRSGGKNSRSIRLLGLNTPVLGRYNADLVFGNDLKSMGQNPTKFIELDSNNGGNKLFHKAISQFKKTNPAAASVYVYPEEDYASMRLFLSPDGKTGVAVKPDGDIVSVFSNDRGGRSAMEIAIQMGGRKLDAFDTVLPDFYKAHGFAETGRLKWDESQAPADWNKAAFKSFNNGEPDVVFMVYDPNGFIVQDIAPTFSDYGAAVDAQMTAMENISPPRVDGTMPDAPAEEQLEDMAVEPRDSTVLDAAVEAAQANIDRTPTGAIPLYNLNASPDALYVAQNPEAGEQFDAQDLIRYSRQNQPQYTTGVQQIIDKLAVDPPNQTPGQTVVTAVQLPPIRNIIDKLRQQFIFNYSRLEYYNQRHPSLINNMADVSSLAGAEMADRHKAITASAITDGVPVYRNGLVRVERFVHNNREYKGLIDVMAPLYSNPYGNLERLAQAYAIAIRGRRLTAEGKLAPGDPADLPQLLAEVRRFTNPATGNSIIEEWYDAWQAYNAYTVQFLRDTGMIDDAGAQLWLQQSDYIPFYRETAAGTVAHPKIFGGLTSTSHMKAVGKSSEAINLPLLDSVLTNLDAAIGMGMRNVAQQRIVRDMIQIGMGRMVQPGQLVEGQPTVTFKVAGKKYTAFIDDPLIFESMQAMPDMGAAGILENVFRVPATVLRELIVREPGYMIANMLRDTASVALTSGANIIPVVDTVRNFNSGLENLRRYGVVGGYDFARDPEQMSEYLADEARKRGHQIPVDYDSKLKGFSKSKYMRPLMAAWDALGGISDKAEASTRNAVYQDTLKRTGNEAEAVYQALSVINYGRRGRNPSIRAITASVPFLNARIQGLDKLYQAGSGQVGKVKDRRKNFANFVFRAGLMTGLTMFYYMLVSDDDEYKNANPEVVDNYYILPVKDADPAKGEKGLAIRIPIPFEVGLLFKTLPERMMRRYYDVDVARDTAQSLKRAVTSTLAFNPVPQAVLPIAEVIANYDTFTGRAIIPPYMDERMAAEYQAKFGTNELARILGEATGISPIKIDHLMNGYLGTLGTYTLDAIDHVARDADRMYPSREPYEYPFVRRFFADSAQPGLQTQYYDLYKEVGKVTNTIRQLREDGRVDELNAYLMENQSILGIKSGVDVLNKRMKQYRDQKEAILKSTLDPEQKKELIDDLDASINQTLQVVPILKRAAYNEQRQAG